MKKKWIFTATAAAFACTAFGLGAVLAEKVSAVAQVEVIETAVVKELEDITGKEVFTKESNGRILGDFDDSKNRALSMKIDLSDNTGYYGVGGYPTLGLSFFGPTDGEPHAGNGHIGALNYQFIMDGRITDEYPNGSMSIVYYDQAVQYVTVAQPEEVYNREVIGFEFGSRAIKTDGVWTGNYLYVKINGEMLLEARDTGAYFQAKSTCVSVSEAAYGYYNNATVFLSNSITMDDVTVYDYEDLTGQQFGDYESSQAATESQRKLGNFSANENVAVRTWIKRTGTQGDHWYGGLSILESSYGACDGYYLDCDWDIKLRRRTGETLYDEDDVLSVATKEKAGYPIAVNVGAIGEVDGFVVEFGVQSVKKNGVRIGNYVYFKVDGKLLHGYFDDSDTFDKKGTGVSVTFRSNLRNYQFATVPSESSLAKIRRAFDLIKPLPDMTAVTLSDKNAIENARAAYDTLTDTEKLYVVNATRLLNAERQLWLVRGDAEADEVTIYDLFDVNGDISNAYMNAVTNPAQREQIQEAIDNGLPFNGRKIGIIQETSNIAFRAKISYQWYVQDTLFIELYIMQKSVTASANNYGYRLWWKDGSIEIQYDKNPLVLGEGDNTIGARLAAEDVTALVGEGIQAAQEEFVLEFGCAKYIAYDAWQGNYVYVKVNGVEVLSFVDSGAFYKDKGNIVANGNYNTWHLYTFESLYEFADITLGEAPEGAAFATGDTQKVALREGYQMLLPFAYGYEITSASLDGDDVTDKILLTQDGYALDCSTLQSGGTLTLTTAKKQVSVSVTENEKAEVLVAETADIRSVLDAKIVTASGYVLTSFTVNGVEYIDEVLLGGDGYYYCNTYRLLQDSTIATAVAEKSYTVSVNKKGEGSVDSVQTVGAFGSVTVTITPSENTLIKRVLLNGEAVNVSADGKITIDRVTEDLFFDVRFAEKPAAVDKTENPTTDTSSNGCNASLTATTMSLTAVFVAISVAVVIKKRKTNG